MINHFPFAAKWNSKNKNKSATFLILNLNIAKFVFISFSLVSHFRSDPIRSSFSIWLLLRWHVSLIYFLYLGFSMFMSSLLLYFFFIFLPFGFRWFQRWKLEKTVSQNWSTRKQETEKHKIPPTPNAPECDVLFLGKRKKKKKNKNLLDTNRAITCVPAATAKTYRFSFLAPKKQNRKTKNKNKFVFFFFLFRSAFCVRKA